MKFFGREPAVWLALAASALQVISGFVFPIGDDAQALINAVLSALFGLITAAAVAQDKLLPAIVGFAQSVLALAVGFGWDLPAEKQAVLMAFVSIVAGTFVRTQVVAPVPPEPARAP